MNKEIEAKFININKAAVIAKLEKLGAKKVFDERMLRRTVYHLPVHKNGAWLRTRDEVDKVTMTYKFYSGQSIDGVDEVELVIDDFEKADHFLKAIGAEAKAYQETRRLRFVMPRENVEFDIDTWPGMEPWIEIEADSEAKVKKYAKALGFDWSEVIFGSADIVYAKIFNIDEDWINNRCPRLVFDDLPPELQATNKRSSKS